MHMYLAQILRIARTTPYNSIFWPLFGIHIVTTAFAIYISLAVQ